MMKTYNAARTKGDQPKEAAGKAGIIPAKMRNGWKKGLVKLPEDMFISDIFEHFGVSYGS